MNKTFFFQLLKWFIAPTLYISDQYKRKATSRQIRGWRVKRLNKIYLSITILLACSIAFLSLLDRIGIQVNKLLWVIPVYDISRCNEIFMAFIKDVFDKLNVKKRDKNGLEYFERIQMALRSYAELILHYGMMYYLLDTYLLPYMLQEPMFNKPLETLFNAIYFSVITIISIGYGDIYPVHPLAKALVMHEVIGGMLLLVVSFTVYVNLTLDE